MKNIKKNIEQVADLLPNYRIIVAEESVIAQMYIEMKKLVASPKRINMTISSIREGRGMLKVILQTIREYQGSLLEKCRVYEYHNKIPSLLREEMAKLIAGETIAPTLKANYLALGNGTTAPADGDTNLENELVRGTFEQRSAVGSTAYLDKFWGSTEVGGLTILEVGTFVDGTATANSGYLLSRVAANIVVGSTETLTINVAISITSAT